MYKNSIIVVFFLALVYLMNEKCSSEKYKDRVKKNLSAQRDSIKFYQLKNGQQVASIKTLRITNQELNDQIWFRDDSLKVLTSKFNKVSAAVKIKTVVKIDSIFVPYKKDTQNKVSRFFDIKTKFIAFNGFVEKNGVIIQEIKIPNTQRLVIGKKRKYFKTFIYTDVSNTNKYLQTEKITSQITTVKNKRFGLGLFAGIGVSLTPQIGIGVSYNFIQF